MHIIDVSNLNFGYTSELVLKDVNLCVDEGQFICITGENGSGKSTLLKVLLGELKHFEGSVKLFGNAINSIKDFKDIGYVPQNSVMNKVAFPTTCREMVAINLYRSFGPVKFPGKKHFERAEKALVDMGLEKYVRTPFNELSGGLQQRVMITRALINDPRLLILDEPTAGVDNESKVRFLDLLETVTQERNITAVLVSHELELVSRHINFDATYRINSGRIAHV
ncbi:metal ABC transporter ATP-binding protein [Fannyhessea vaginae]|jgi:ABC superfamily ATP binding cassette transporter, ABC protein|uniref:metal ABC transporter ATP-binding protein n=1 Tax=Fannyhessea vaginae TaxID=82135 RepID=UPI00076F9622|nr:ATP-binding cassette domain-containing protein [Fannyhessea vaginae]KXG89184.1 ABC transporter, ATP-binding protein [Fannyhessea vaginae]